MLDDSMIGRSLKEFVIREHIGRGGMASVYRAYQPAVHRDVAVKVINLGGENYDEQFRERFAQEAELIARLEHIHILPIYDYGVVDDLAFIAMRLLTGGTLQDLIAQKTLTMDRAADLFIQIASGLGFAHSRGVIHRDLKPGNILLDDVGNAYIADFGLAKLLSASLELTDHDNIVGTPHYMAPEQIRGEALSPRSDIYSLGVLLYQMLCGNLPHRDTGKGLVSSIYQSLEEPPIPPRQWKPEISEALEDVILKAINKSPADRFVTTSEMARAVNRAIGRPSDIHHVESAGPATLNLVRDSIYRLTRSKQRRYVLPAVGLFVVVIVALASMLVGGDEQIAFGPPVVLEGETNADDIIPGDSEISRASARIGQNEFLALIACNTSSQYHATQAREIVEFARAYGLNVRVYDSDSDAYRQVTELETARAQGAQGLFICTLDFELLDKPLKDAQAAGLPMVFMHGDTPNYGGVRMVSDNYLMGKIPGLYAGQLVADERDGQARAITLDYPDVEDVVIRANGLEDGLLEMAPNAQLIGRYLGGTRDFGEESVRTLLEEGVVFDVILSINDAGAYGAIAALEDAGYAGDEVIIVSVDAEDLARRYIEDGHFMRASVSVGRTEASRGAVDAMVKLLAGSPVPMDILTEPGALITRQTVN